MDIFSAIRHRRSSSRLVAPGPTTEEIRTILGAAVCAPDHGRCRPWRFVVLDETNKAGFGAVLEEAYLARCGQQRSRVDEERLRREREKVSRAPVVVVAICRPSSTAPIPHSEQRAAVAAATQNALLAATALGFGSMWRTGVLATDAVVRRALRLRSEESIEGFVYLGSLPKDTGRRAPRERDLDDVVEPWPHPTIAAGDEHGQVEVAELVPVER